MPNPFKTRFDSECQDCGGMVDEGEFMYAVDGSFLCQDCANSEGVVCNCGNIKRESYDRCWDCFQKNTKKSQGGLQ